MFDAIAVAKACVETNLKRRGDYIHKPFIHMYLRLTLV